MQAVNQSLVKYDGMHLDEMLQDAIYLFIYNAVTVWKTDVCY